MIDRAAIEAAVRTNETEDWEFKSGRGGLPKNTWETVSAMANTRGGTIVIGVTERDDCFHVDGLENPHGIEKSIWDGLHNRQVISAFSMRPDAVRVETVHGAAVVVVEVPRASREERPVHLKNDTMTGTWRRRASGDYHATRPEVHRMIADSVQEEARDGRILEQFSVGHLDHETIKQYRARMSAHRPEHPWLVMEEIEWLERLGAVRWDRISTLKHPTLAGMLMFGRDDLIREVVPMYDLDFRSRASNSISDWDDRIHADGTWSGNLFQFYMRVLPRLLERLPVPFKVDASLMRVQDVPSHIAVREALVNALVHSDYDAPGGVVVDAWPDRFSIANPGTLLISRDQLWKGGTSVCRNPRLQRMFQLMGAGDKAGAGMDRIAQGWRSQHWVPPSLREQFSPDRIELVLSRVSLLPHEATDALRTRFGEEFESLEPNERLALVYALQEHEITNSRLQELTTLHRVELTALLRGLVDRSFLARDGRTVATTYRLPSFRPITPIASPAHVPGTAIEIPATAVDIPGSASIVAINAGRDHHDDDAIAHVRSHAKADADTVRRAIRSLCSKRWMTAAEIAEALGRSTKALQNEHLAMMVAAEELFLRNPKAPRSRKQAYATRMIAAQIGLFDPLKGSPR